MIRHCSDWVVVLLYKCNNNEQRKSNFSQTFSTIASDQCIFRLKKFNRNSGYLFSEFGWEIILSEEHFVQLLRNKNNMSRVATRCCLLTSLMFEFRKDYATGCHWTPPQYKSYCFVCICCVYTLDGRQSQGIHTICLAELNIICVYVYNCLLISVVNIVSRRKTPLIHLNSVIFLSKIHCQEINK